MGEYSSSTEGSGDKFAQTALPILGSVVGAFFGPGGSIVGHQAGTNAGNLFATGDLAGAPAGSSASDLTNMGGLFQGQGLSGFGRYLLGNILDPFSSIAMLGTASAGGGTAYYGEGGAGSTAPGTVGSGLEQISAATGQSNPYLSNNVSSGTGKSGGTGSNSIWTAGK